MSEILASYNSDVYLARDFIEHAGGPVNTYFSVPLEGGGARKHDEGSELQPLGALMYFPMQNPKTKERLSIVSYDSESLPKPEAVLQTTRRMSIVKTAGELTVAKEYRDNYLYRGAAEHLDASEYCRGLGIPLVAISYYRVKGERQSAAKLHSLGHLPPEDSMISLKHMIALYSADKKRLKLDVAIPRKSFSPALVS